MTAQREAADQRVAEAELACERRLDELEASVQARSTSACAEPAVPLVAEGSSMCMPCYVS